jgi:hypothetical protein
MRKLFLTLFALSVASSAFALGPTKGTSTTTVAATTTKILDANDIVGGRSYLFIQNLSASVQITCTIGVSAGATTATGIQLPAGASYVAMAIQTANGVIVGPANGEVDCIAASTTAATTVIDY